MIGLIRTWRAKGPMSTCERTWSGARAAAQTAAAAELRSWFDGWQPERG